MVGADVLCKSTTHIFGVKPLSKILKPKSQGLHISYKYQDTINWGYRATVLASIQHGSVPNKYKSWNMVLSRKDIDI